MKVPLLYNKTQKTIKQMYLQGDAHKYFYDMASLIF